jgi:hypothetical protein
MHAVKNPVGDKIFAKIPGFFIFEQNLKGVHHIEFHCNFINKFFENLSGDPMPAPLTPLCVCIVST